jgi:hypothetical protein
LIELLFEFELLDSVNGYRRHIMSLGKKTKGSKTGHTKKKISRIQVELNFPFSDLETERQSMF